ncbi:MAG: hypothetical protein GTN49_13165 [candidate division Zixibacteria bacterium]|nr:hypothetical protein [candidate division Zixibacteria bacterium]
MKKTLLWILFFLFLILLISPVDLTPGPIDDVIYAVLDGIILALLGRGREKKKAPSASERAEGASKDS